MHSVVTRFKLVRSLFGMSVMSSNDAILFRLNSFVVVIVIRVNDWVVGINCMKHTRVVIRYWSHIMGIIIVMVELVMSLMIS